MLLIAILLGSLAAGSASNYKRPLAHRRRWRRCVATAITWVLATLVIDIAPVNRELLEAVTALFAVVVLIAVSFWLIQRLEHKRRMEFMRARDRGGDRRRHDGGVLRPRLHRGLPRGLRDRALLPGARRCSPRASGCGSRSASSAAVVALGGVGYAILGLGKKLPLKPMLITGASILLLLSVAFAGNAVRSLQDADVVAATPVHAGWARLPVFARRAHRHPPDAPGPDRAGGAAGDLRARRRVGVRAGAAAPAPAARRSRPRDARRGGLRVGVDVGGTFTKAVAVAAHAAARCARTRSCRRATTRPTASSTGVAAALRELLDELGDDRAQVDLVAYSTTTGDERAARGRRRARRRRSASAAEPELRQARKRTRVGDARARAGPRAAHRARVPRRHARPRPTRAIDAALDDLQARGCTALAVSGAFSVDAPEHEDHVAARAHERGLPICAGHELTGTYGLELRTVRRAVNASILPVVERTASVVDRVLHEADIDVPLLVLRGDGGAMSLEAFRARAVAARSARARRPASPRRCTSCS